MHCGGLFLNPFAYYIDSSSAFAVPYLFVSSAQVCYYMILDGDDERLRRFYARRVPTVRTKAERRAMGKGRLL
jgi:hypothetical protein